MNKFIFILMIIICIGCSDNMSKKENDSVAFSPSITSENAYSILISEKIQDYFDTKKLMQKYPDFNKPSESNLSFLEAKASIESVTIIDPINTSHIEKQELKTVISYEGNKENDTIISRIEKSKIIIDDEEVTSTKVTFTPNNK